MPAKEYAICYFCLYEQLVDLFLEIYQLILAHKLNPDLFANLFFYIESRYFKKDQDQYQILKHLYDKTLRCLNGFRPNHDLILFKDDMVKEIAELFDDEPNKDIIIEGNCRIDKQIWANFSFYKQLNENSSLLGDQLTKLLKLYRKIIFEGQDTNYEKWRQLFKNMVRLKLLDYQVEAKEHKDVLLDQIDFISSLQISIDLEDALNTFNVFIKCIDAFTKRVSILDKMDGNSNELRNSVKALLILLIKDIKEIQNVNAYIHSFQTINDFLTQLSGLNLPWLVDEGQKKQCSIPEKFLELVNKETCVYEVKDIDGYLNSPGSTRPKHHALVAITSVIRKISDMQFDDKKSDIEARTVLLATLCSSLQVLKDQINFKSLTQFSSDFAAPFNFIIQNSTDIDQLKSNCNIIDKFYIFNRTQMSIDELLEKLKEQGNIELNKCYSTYSTLFSDYYGKITTCEKTQLEIINETKETASLPHKILALWSLSDRNKHIPKILAGLSIIFSLVESNIKNNKSQYDYLLKPNCVQIIAIFQLLSVGVKPEKLYSSLAEILTGQGKSWILALLAATLALTGHDVKIVCYSDRLSQRDMHNASKFFECLGLKNVSYTTFEKMCFAKLDYSEEINSTFLISTLLDGRDYKIPQLTVPLLLSKNSVLLVDEVDVLFSDLYGTSINPCVQYRHPALAQLQQKIWNLIIKADTGLRELVCIPTDLKTLDYRNFITVQVERMIDDAKTTLKGSRDHYYRYNQVLNCIESQGRNSIFSHNIFYGYENVFQYLRYCQNNQIPPLESDNYGYLQIQTGKVSYAELPSDFSLILGVTGSLSQLVESEKEALNGYEITRILKYPAFWGKSRLEFDSTSLHHYQLLVDETKWQESIIQQAKDILEMDRAVLIFFNTDKLLNEFYTKIAHSRLPNINILTQDCKDLEKNTVINRQSGQPGYVTLATKHYGRGEDFIASATVNERGEHMSFRLFYHQT